MTVKTYEIHRSSMYVIDKCKIHKNKRWPIDFNYML